MSSIVTVAALSAKAIFREKISYLPVAAALLFLLVALVLGGLNIGSEHKLFEDVLLTSQGYLLLIGALFYTFWLLGRSNIQGFFLLPHVSGMKRGEYLSALMLALFLATGLLFVFLILLDAIFLLGLEGEIHAPLLAQLFLYFLAALLCAYVAAALSFYVSLTKSLLSALLLFWVGHALDELYIYMVLHGNLEYPTLLLYYLLPNFSFFDKQGFVVNRGDFSWGRDALLPLIYFILWSGILFLAAWFRFRNKALTHER